MSLKHTIIVRRADHTIQYDRYYITKMEEKHAQDPFTYI